MGVLQNSKNYPAALADIIGGIMLMDWQKGAADGAAATATPETVIGQVNFGMTVVAVRFLPSAALTADPTNNATILVQKRTGAGAPTTVATATTTAGGTGSWTAFVPVNIPISAGTLLAGDVLTVTISKGGTGVIVPAGELDVFQG